MSNKIQISCNHQNRITVRITKLYWQMIELDQIELLKSLVERNDLKTKLIRLRHQEQDEHLEIIQLKRVLKRIRFIRERMTKINNWRIKGLKHLVIC